MDDLDRDGTVERRLDALVYAAHSADVDELADPVAIPDRASAEGVGGGLLLEDGDDATFRTEPAPRHGVTAAQCPHSLIGRPMGGGCQRTTWQGHDAG